jgi:pyruvate formate lyase activating enzyme
MEQGLTTGRVHSVETLGCADGPGLRMVVFMQGCRLRCAYCHNPDTWDIDAGKETSVDEIYGKALRYRTYFGSNGGVTLSGGEPLLQPEFAFQLFRRLRAAGISTAVDTAGVQVTDPVARVLSLTDIVLLDLKMPDQKRYGDLTGGQLETAMNFLSSASNSGCRIWIRHVIVPGLNDTREDMYSLAQLLKNRGARIEKVELLPYHSMGIEKYRLMGLPYRLEGTFDMDAERLKELQDYIGNIIF